MHKLTYLINLCLFEIAVIWVWSFPNSFNDQSIIICWFFFQFYMFVAICFHCHLKSTAHWKGTNFVSVWLQFQLHQRQQLVYIFLNFKRMSNCKNAKYIEMFSVSCILISKHYWLGNIIVCFVSSDLMLMLISFSYCYMCSVKKIKCS